MFVRNLSGFFSTVRSSFLRLEGYKLVRADHPNNVKRGGVCIYYKESLPDRVIKLPHRQEAIKTKK